MPVPADPKIELHVHLEGSVRPPTLIRLARRNGVHLPAEDEAALARLYEFRDFAHFLELWELTTCAIRTEEDFRQIVVDYAAEAIAHGAVYLEAIFTPIERVLAGASWDEVFNGFCDGADEAEERFGILVRFTPDIPRQLGEEAAIETVRHASRYRDRGVVGVGIGGPEAGFPPGPFARAFRLAKEAGLGSVPHAGEAAGPDSIRGALDALGADRIRHGIRAVEDRSLLDELAERRIVCDVCPTSNLRTRTASPDQPHPLSQMLEAGLLCTINTDDPAMFGTDLSQEHELAARLGSSPERAFGAGIAGALCGEKDKASLAALGRSHGWRC